MKRFKNCEKLIKIGMSKQDMEKLLTTRSSRNKKYWMERGFNEDESIKMSKSKMPGTFEYFKYFKGINDDNESRRLSEEFHKNSAKTLENFIKKYGNKIGNGKWKIYCDKQSCKNTFEFKHKKYG